MSFYRVVLALSCLCLSGLSRAGQLETLQSMAGDPTLLSPAYTGEKLSAGSTQGVAASGAGRSAGPLSASLTPSARMESGAAGSTGLTARGNKSRRGDGPFVKGIKAFFSRVAGCGAFGAFIGLCVGIFGAPTLVAGTLAGAAIGATIGAVFGLFAMLGEWSKESKK